MNRILITGGTGKLAHELRKHLKSQEGLEVEYVGIEDWDFIYPEEIPKNKYDLIVHMGAYTDVAKAEIEKEKCMLTNVLGTFNLVQAHKDTSFLYISSEYCKNPLGVYALSKQLGEEIIKTLPHYKILRTLFKPTPFPFDHAYEDQYTQGDYVDVIAKLLAEKIFNWTWGGQSLEYLGTGRKTILELAKRTRPDVKPNKIEDYKYAHLIPHDYK